MDELDTIKNHVHYFSEIIGQRGSTTNNEKKAAKYAEKVYQNLGLSPQTETFLGAKSAWLPYSLGASLVLLSEVLYFFGGKPGALVATILTFITLVSLIQELSFKPNLFRLALPKGKSQNVSVRLDPQREVRQTIILMGHLDTHRTPLSHRSPKLFFSFTILTKTTFFSIIILCPIFLINIFLDLPALRFISIIPMLPVIILLFLAVSADYTPYSPGANDNATGAALVMALAEHLVKSPLQQTRVWSVNTGCEEVGAYGAVAWFKEHRGELDGAYCLTLDNIGGADTSTCYLTKEGLIFPLSSDIELVKLADIVAIQHPSLNAHPFEMKASYTDSAIGIRAGLKCLSFVNYRPDNFIPNWHQPSDVIDNIDWKVVKKTADFVWNLIQLIDKQE